MVRTLPRLSSPTLLPDLVCTERDTAGERPAPAPKLCGAAAPLCAPAVPVAPRAPAFPAVAPRAPAAPVAPRPPVVVAPRAPAGPVAPRAPAPVAVAPRAPAPAAPVVPRAPVPVAVVAPRAPVAPVAPRAPVVPAVAGRAPAVPAVLLLGAAAAGRGAAAAGLAGAAAGFEGAGGLGFLACAPARHGNNRRAARVTNQLETNLLQRKAGFISSAPRCARPSFCNHFAENWDGRRLFAGLGRRMGRSRRPQVSGKILAFRAGVNDFFSVCAGFEC